MDTMTTTDYQIEEDEANRREACYDTALNEYLEIAEKIKQKFEHFLDDTPICDVDFNKLRIMCICYELMASKANYHYVDDYDDIEYDFTEELNAMLLDEYGWEV